MAKLNTTVRVIVREEPLVEKVCPICGDTFSGLARQAYNTRSCANRADYLAHAEQRRAARRQRYEQQKGQP